MATHMARWLAFNHNGAYRENGVHPVDLSAVSGSAELMFEESTDQVAGHMGNIAARQYIVTSITEVAP